MATTFKIPEGYQPPEGTEDGQTFDESVTFKLKGDRLELTEINGTPLSGEKEGRKAGESSDQEDEDFKSRYQQAMQSDAPTQ